MFVSEMNGTLLLKDFSSDGQWRLSFYKLQYNSQVQCCFRTVFSTDMTSQFTLGNKCFYTLVFLLACLLARSPTSHTSQSVHSDGAKGEGGETGLQVVTDPWNVLQFPLPHAHYHRVWEHVLFPHSVISFVAEGTVQVQVLFNTKKSQQTFSSLQTEMSQPFLMVIPA